MIGGGPTDADNRRARYRGAVAVQFAVGTEGRVSNCSVTRSSGNPQLDGMTCRLLVERGRFAPARDAQGRPIQSRINASYVYGRGHRSRN
jgi:protein TonB